MIEQALINRMDVFCTGVLLGVVSVFLGQWLRAFLDLWFMNNEKKLDIELGKALIKIHNELQKGECPHCKNGVRYNSAANKLEICSHCNLTDYLGEKAATK